MKLSGTNDSGDTVEVEVTGPRTVVRTITTGEQVHRQDFHLTRSGKAERVARRIFAIAIEG